MEKEKAGAIIHQDLELFQQRMKSDYALFKQEMKSENASFQQEMKSENASFQQEIRNDFQTYLSEIDTKIVEGVNKRMDKMVKFFSWAGGIIFVAIFSYFEYMRTRVDQVNDARIAQVESAVLISASESVGVGQDSDKGKKNKNKKAVAVGKNRKR